MTALDDRHSSRLFRRAALLHHRAGALDLTRGALAAGAGSAIPAASARVRKRDLDYIYGSPVEIVEPLLTLTMDATTALAIYRAEKDKALRERRVSHVQLMAEAQEAFRKMLADAQLARKGGRPKGSTNAAATPIVVTATQAAAAVTGKLVLKTTKVAAPAKKAEKVTAVATTTTVKVAKAPKAEAAPKAAAKPAKKKAVPVKAKPVAKVSARRAAASARKPASKKATAPRKQAAARERSAKARKR